MHDLRPVNGELWRPSPNCIVKANKMCEMADIKRLHMNCPKCGFQQDGGPQCLRCGLVFAHYHAAAAFPQPKSEQSRSSDQSIVALLRRFYRIFRWVSLAGLIVVIFLILHDSPPPQIVITPDASQHAEAKIQEFQSSANQSGERKLEIDQSELNAWLSENLVLGRPRDSVPSNQTPESAISPDKKATGSQTLDDRSLEQMQSSIRDVKIELLEDSLRLYAIFDLHGVGLSMQLEGQPLVRDGYMRLELTGGKLGSFPLTAGMLQSVAKRLFDSPENKEKFRLPPHIRDIRIESGQLVVTSS